MDRVFGSAQSPEERRRRQEQQQRLNGGGGRVGAGGLVVEGPGRPQGLRVQALHVHLRRLRSFSEVVLARRHHVEHAPILVRARQVRAASQLRLQLLQSLPTVVLQGRQFC